MTESVIDEAQARLDARKVKPPEMQPLASALERAQGIVAARPPVDEERERAEHLARKEAEALDTKRRYSMQWLEGTGVPLRYRREIPKGALIPEALAAWGRAIAETIEHGGGALIAGPPGSGKTAAAVWLILETYRRWQLYRNEESVWFCPPGVLFVCASDLFSELHRGSDRKRWDQAERVALLVIDDWGAPYEGSGWGPGELDALVNRRWAELRTTVVTTNLPATAQAGVESFETRYPRAFSRLTDAAGPGVVEIIREDLRSRKP